MEEGCKKKNVASFLLKGRNLGWIIKIILYQYINV
jgi:hypothetical protein